MKTSVITCFKKYVTVEGRASRSEYWWFMLFGVLVGLILGLCLGFISIILVWDYDFDSMVTSVSSNIMSLILLFPSICVSIRRLHDIDRRGWWFLLWLIPVIGWIIMLYFICKKGTEGDNLFGKDPLAE